MPETSPPKAAPVGRGLATFVALSAPNFRYFWFGLISYVVGYRAEYVTSAWLVWELTHDPLYLGYLGVAQGAPMVVLQIFGGVLADRVQRLRLLLVTTTFTSVLMVAAFLLTLTGLVRVEHLLVLSVLSAVFRSFDEPSRVALLPSLIDRARLTNAIALSSIPWQSGRILGPSIAGVVIALLGGAAGFAMAAVASFLAIGLYSRIRLESALGGGKHGSMLENLVQGFSFVARHSLFTYLILLSFLNSIFGMMYVALLPIFSSEYFNAGSSGYGLMQGATGVGALVGTLTIATMAQRLKQRGKVLLMGGIGFGLTLVVFALSPSLGFALAVLTLMGLANTFYLTVVNTILQERVPDELRGRVMGIFGLTWNLIPLSGLLGGVLAALVDARFAVLVGGLVVTGSAALLLGLSKPLRSIP